jgi:hypothetical protein
MYIYINMYYLRDSAAVKERECGKERARGGQEQGVGTFGSCWLGCAKKESGAECVATDCHKDPNSCVSMY